MSVVEGLKIQIHVCGTYVLSVWFTLLIGFGSVWIFSRFIDHLFVHSISYQLKVIIANNKILFLMLSGRSFTKSKNKIGPRTDPCGTPGTIFKTSEKLSPTPTRISLSLRKSSIISRVSPVRYPNLTNNLW